MTQDQVLDLLNILGWTLAGWFWLKTQKLLRIADVQQDVIEAFTEFLKIVNDTQAAQQTEEVKEAA